MPNFPVRHNFLTTFQEEELAEIRRIAARERYQWEIVSADGSRDRDPQRYAYAQNKIILCERIIEKCERLLGQEVRK